MGNEVTVPSSRQPIPPARGNESIDFIHREERDAIHEHKEVGILRCTATFLRQIDFSAAVLRNRLGRCLAAKQLDGIIAFDTQLESPLLLKAIWLVDTQQWTEAGNALKLAVQRGFCTLPVTMSVQDMQRHTTKQAYLAEPRVLALWKMVGRHVNFGGQLGRFELFDQAGGGVRAIKDEPGFELDINPPLPPAHPYHTHTINDNPPVRDRLPYRLRPMMGGDGVITEASASSFIMRIIMTPGVANRGWTPWVDVDRHAHGGVLIGLLNHSPHQPPNRCTAVVAGRGDGRDPPGELRQLLLTPFDGPFVAYIALATQANMDTVGVAVVTTEPPVGDASAAFKDRRPATVPLVGGLVGQPIADMVVNQQEVADEEESADDDDGDSEDDDEGAEDGDSDEDMEGDIDGEGDGEGNGDGQQQQQEGEGVERPREGGWRTARWHGGC
ncbi:unnamed protein product [Vitrella brassicaformis CCMP3155]|uniref:Uncharacterized protein n=1 Tax=Vitrella brassicaformis (strain CCMP3155) TaxID=1169540 RepID=A0A0G4FIM0_VITBC|nr:unnamed protein product [Vitrella brassicaformis CCMP3155]|eukprot:CEM13493.1 unnamed protein product [Vitrella brassicaformis CCMP3155]